MATVAGAVIGVVGVVAGALIQGSEGRRAAKKQEKAALSAADIRATGFEEAVQPRLQGLQAASEQFQPFATGGQSAFQLQLAQSGALGAEAQQDFFENFSTSPSTEFRLGEARRFVESGGEEFGGLGGGNRLRRLQEIGLGLVQEDLNNRFNQLGALSGVGFQASGQLSNIDISAGEARARGIEGAAGVTGTGLQQAAFQSASGDVAAGARGRESAESIAEIVSAVILAREQEGRGAPARAMV